MKKRIALLFVGAWLLCPTAGFSQANAPKSAAPPKLALITGYEPCDAPNALHNGFVPACNPPVRNDTVCGFGPSGSGKFKVKRTPNASPPMASTVLLQNLDAGCEGETLCQVTSFRVTNAVDAGCGVGGCTIETTLGPPTGCCTVQNGKCKISGFISHGIHQFNGTQEAELLGCGVLRTTGPSLPSDPTFVCGYKVK